MSKLKISVGKGGGGLTQTMSYEDNIIPGQIIPGQCLGYPPPLHTEIFNLDNVLKRQCPMHLDNVPPGQCSTRTMSYKENALEGQRPSWKFCGQGGGITQTMCWFQDLDIDTGANQYQRSWYNYRTTQTRLRYGSPKCSWQKTWQHQTCRSWESLFCSQNKATDSAPSEYKLGAQNMCVWQSTMFAGQVFSVSTMNADRVFQNGHLNNLPYAQRNWVFSGASPHLNSLSFTILGFAKCISKNYTRLAAITTNFAHKADYDMLTVQKIDSIAVAWNQSPWNAGPKLSVCFSE